MIYADYNASAPICEDVQTYLIERLRKGPYANPNTIHRLGKTVLMGMENARSICAKALGAKMSQVIFNSGSTEGIATAFHSILSPAKKAGKNIIILSGQEHSAVRKTAEYYCQEHHFQLKMVPTLCSGLIDLDQLQKMMKEDSQQLAVVTIMAANNETGIIQPYKAIGSLCKEHGVPFFSDTTQFIGKDSFEFESSQMDYAVMSGHKIGALTGTGILLVREPSKIIPLIIGGGQERGYRGGTQNYIGNETLAVALSYFQKNQAKFEALRAKRETFEQNIKRAFPQAVIIGDGSPRLASTTYIAYPGVHGQAIQIELESEDIYVSTSSACSDNQPVTSPVLKCMNIDDKIGRGVVRISLGPCSPPDFYDKIEAALIKAYTKLTKVHSF